MRVAIPFTGYAIAALTGTAVLIVSNLVLSDANNAGLLLALFLLIFGTAIGSIVVLPVALPVIMCTEWTTKGPWWLFLAAGCLAGMLLFALLGSPTSFAAQDEHNTFRDVAVMLLITISASMSYWNYVWRINPPETNFRPDFEVL